MKIQYKQNTALEANEELASARLKHPKKFNSLHEGLSVLEEEVYELRMEVYTRKPDHAKLREEALQVAAMALRFVEDLIDG